MRTPKNKMKKGAKEMTTSNEGKQFFIHIPEIIIDCIKKELNLESPPVEAVESVVVWCTAQILDSDCLFDYKTAFKSDVRGILKTLDAETEGYLKELEKEE